MRPKKPFNCMPTYFTPADIVTKQAGGERIHFIVKSGKKYPVDVSDFTEFSTIPYTFSVITPQAPDCQSRALLVLKNGKQYAFYTHILWKQLGSLPIGSEFFGREGWQYEPTLKSLLIHNIVIEKGQWMEKMRLIDLPTKTAKNLPLDQCFIQGYIRSDGMIMATFMENYQNAPTVNCFMQNDGNMVYKAHPQNVGGSSMIFYRVPGNNSTMLVLDVSSHVLRSNAVIKKDTPELHRLIALDMTNKRTWATFLFPNDQPSGFVTGFNDNENEPQFDLSKFSWKKPAIRYRSKVYDNGYCCEGSWKWGSWKDMIFEKVYNG